MSISWQDLKTSSSLHGCHSLVKYLANHSTSAPTTRTSDDGMEITYKDVTLDVRLWCKGLERLQRQPPKLLIVFAMDRTLDLRTQFTCGMTGQTLAGHTPDLSLKHFSLTPSLFWTPCSTIKSWDLPFRLMENQWSLTSIRSRSTSQYSMKSTKCWQFLYSSCAVGQHVWQNSVMASSQIPIVPVVCFSMNMVQSGMWCGESNGRILWGARFSSQRSVLLSFRICSRGICLSSGPLKHASLNTSMKRGLKLQSWPSTTTPHLCGYEMAKGSRHARLERMLLTF